MRGVASDYFDDVERSVSKKGKRKGKKQHNLSLKTIEPITDNQAKAFDEFFNDYHLILHGHAGTGKTFIALYLALDEVINDNIFNNVTVIRSTVPTRDIGFLPGKINEKISAYETPYTAIVNKLFNRGDAYEILKSKGVINFIPSSFLRGTTLDDSIVIIDECQNMTDPELHTIITRLGDNSKLILCGDFRQNDLQREHTGIFKIMDILKKVEDFRRIEFGIEDVVRSGLVKDYLVARNDFEQGNNTSKD